MKTDQFPMTVAEAGVSAKIYRANQTKNGKTYPGFIVAYSLLGKRKQVFRASLDDAEAFAREACQRIANGEHLALTLTNSDRMAYVRACEALVPTKIALDTACRDYADAFAILNGRAGLAEVCRDWIKRNSVQLPRITIRAAVDELERQSLADKKSAHRRKQLAGLLGRFANDISLEVHNVTPEIVSRWLSALPLAERTRRNYRDMLGFFCRWLVMRGYLAKGTDWLEGVQNYSARKLGQIELFTPDEITTLLRYGEKHFQTMVPFLAVGAFAGLRHAEIARLDWREVELSEQPGESWLEVKAENAKTDVRRLVPVRDNLKAWLLPHRKSSGKLCPLANTTKQLLNLAAAAGVEWKHNALRHSCISYRIAECSDVPRVAEESGNSPQIIRTNYLRRVKPAVAAAWFAIMPAVKAKGRKLAVQPDAKPNFNPQPETAEK